jgi:hypothetical protein
MDKFWQWYRTYIVEITWFIIGWLTVSGYDNLYQGNTLYAAMDFALAYLNYHMWKTRF